MNDITGLGEKLERKAFIKDVRLQTGRIRILVTILQHQPPKNARIRCNPLTGGTNIPAPGAAALVEVMEENLQATRANPQGMRLAPEAQGTLVDPEIRMDMVMETEETETLRLRILVVLTTTILDFHQYGNVTKTLRPRRLGHV